MRTMRKTKIPVFIDPSKVAQQKLSFSGLLPSKNLKRLVAECQNSCSEIKVDIECSIDVQGLACIKGSASADIELVCQRCVQSYHQAIEAHFCYSPVDSSSDADELPENYDAVEVDDHGLLQLHHLIEDELILAIPLIAMHDDSSCFSGKNDVTIGDIPNVEIEERKNPFEALASLKKLSK
jgi:uncharacterized protein